MRTNRSVRFGFGGGTVIVASRGHPVSFYTTDGVAWLCERLVKGRCQYKKSKLIVIQQTA